MSNLPFISPDDPRLTAFALGELEGEDLAAVEAALRDNPAARAAVDEIRAMAGQMESALSTEPMEAHAPVVRAKSYAKRGKLLSFPQLYYLAGGMAAAAFAIVLVRHETHMAPQKHVYAELRLDAPAPETVADAVVNAPAAETLATAEMAMPARQANRDTAVAEVNLPIPPAQAPYYPASSDRLKELSQVSGLGTVNQSYAKNEPKAADAKSAGKLTPVGVATKTGKAKTPLIIGGVSLASMPNEAAPAASGSAHADSAFTRKSAAAGGTLAHENEVAMISHSQVAAQKDDGYLNPNAATATRIGMEVQRTPSEMKIRSAEFLAETKHQTPINVAPYSRASSSEAPDGFLSERTARNKTEFNTENYAYQRDNDFLSAAENPLSTFSVDVDTASYANVRRFLNAGQLPPPDAVRIEELVNYFPYHYAPPPADKPNKDAQLDPFAASMEVADAPWAPGHRLVRIGLKGREVSLAERAPANLVFLLDVSGSMNEPNKLPLVKESLRLLISKLRPDDRVAIVVYAGASGLALPSTPVAKSAEIIGALEALTPGGSTNGAMGIQLAYDIAKANFVTGGLNRVILCTDGDFNVGVTGEGDLTRLIEEKAKSGVFLTVLGFGMGDYKDSMLEKLADKGNGNYGYIDSRREAEKLLVEQVNGTLLTIAKDVKLQVEFNPAQVASYRLIGYENRLLKKEDFNNDAVDAGEIGAGHTVTALYEVVPTSRVRGEGSEVMGLPAVDELKYRKAEGYDDRAVMKDSNRSDWPSRELLTLKVRFKEPTGTVSRKLVFPLTDSGAAFATASADFKFAAAVAEFGMILRDSPHKGTATLADVLVWAQAGTDSDAGGYREEFIELV
ncbi:MAG: von Willebrand factor type A domain-containing protein [Opitutaceae bacterium]